MSSATITERTALQQETRVEPHRLGETVMKYLTTTDHKVIGNMYFVTAFFFFGFGGSAGSARRHGTHHHGGGGGNAEFLFEGFDQFAQFEHRQPRDFFDNRIQFVSHFVVTPVTFTPRKGQAAASPLVSFCLRI